MYKRQLDNIVDAFRQGNGFFPGDPFISGLENRSDIRGTREGWYTKAIKLSELLLALGEFEDIALENKERAAQNLSLIHT